MGHRRFLFHHNKSRLEFSVVLPYYNEYDYIENTIASWLNQRKLPAEIILVDNGSTDGSGRLVRTCLKGEQRIRTVFLEESRPGKTYALQTGIEKVACPFIALSDADTCYPPHYLELGAHLFAVHGDTLSAVMALPAFDNPLSEQSKLHRQSIVILNKLWRKHTFVGGYGQLFRRKALQDAGGFSDIFWPYVLLDHEIMYRIFKKGYSVYHRNLWCCPSGRRRNRARVRWNLPERLLYTLTPHCLQGWFFYKFLKKRFEARGLHQLRLREQPWASVPSGRS